jgi:ribosomal protein S18 acetylase RimI-like enzyme
MYSEGALLMRVRNADRYELNEIARVWHEGWHEAHARLVPASLTRVRTVDAFKNRLQSMLHDIRVVGPSGDPDGFCIVKDDEVYQLYVSSRSRLSGVATALLNDAEARLRANGIETAWLACAVGNDRAARFYEARGWRRVATLVNHLDPATDGLAPEVWRYEKRLAAIEQPSL